MIRLNVFIQVSADNRAAVMEMANELVACSLKDNGCIAYDIFESATREDVLMICETWKDEESLAAHEKATHFVTGEIQFLMISLQTYCLEKSTIVLTFLFLQFLQFIR